MEEETKCKDGTCLLHSTVEACLEVSKGNIKIIEAWQSDIGQRVAAIEPVIKHNTQEIDGMKRLQLATLATGLFSAISIVVGLAFIIIRHLL